MNQPDIVIFDEPTVGLDAPTRNRISQIIRSLKVDGRTVIVISHDMDFIAPLVDRVVILNDGQIFADESTLTIFSDVDLLTEAGLEPPSIIRFRSELENAGVSVTRESLDISEVMRQLAIR